jgi:glycine oxidase
MTYDVVIAGGGVIGMSAAWRSAVAGLRVAVVDEAPGTGSTYAAAGMLAAVTEASYGEEPLLALCRASLARYPSFVADVEEASGLPAGLRTAGTLMVGFDDDDMRAIAELHAFQVSLGLDARRLTSREARAAEPALTPRLRGALAVAGDHSVDPRALHAALLVAAERAGVELLPSRVHALLVEGGRAVGVVTDRGELRGEAVVVALGAWSGQLPGTPPIPVRAVKGQILRLRGPAVLTGTVRALVRGRSVYLVPYGDDRLVVGATMEELGFDDRVTAGAVLDLLTDATEVVPDLAELELLETTVRWRPGSPDNAPLVGAASMPGLVLATGHHRNGVLLAPITAEAVVAVLTGGDVPDEVLALGPTRFEEALCR